jgi:small GTP-binding protein
MAETTFAEHRDSLLSALADLSTELDRHEASDAAASARALTKKLEAETFNVVVVGAFKRGKSTLVNALLGEALLPTAAVPLTTVVTCVAFGKRRHAEVTFIDGRITEIAPEEIARFVTETENPSNSLGVDRVVVTSASAALADGVFLEDTPGIESVHRHNTEAAYQALPETDAAILVTSADPPISETERLFLEDVRKSAARILVALNKIDHVRPDQVDDTLAYTARVVDSVLGAGTAIYPLSARDALDAKLSGDSEGLQRSGVPELERDLRALLLNDRGTVLLEATRIRALRVLDARLDALSVEWRLLDLSEDKLALVADRLEEVFTDAERIRNDLVTLLGQETGRLVRMVEEDLAALWSTESSSLRESTIARIRGRDRLDPEDVEREMQETLRHDVDAWRHSEEEKLAAAFQGATKRYRGGVQGLMTRTIELAAEALDVAFTSAPEPVTLSEESSFSYHFVDGVPTLTESLLPDGRRRLPQRMIRRKLERDLYARIPRIVDKQCGRLRYDFVRRLERGCAELQRQLDDRLAGSVGAIRAATERSTAQRAAGATRLAERRHEIDGERSALHSIRIRLEESIR